jgi:hypothetical protein
MSLQLGAFVAARSLSTAGNEHEGLGWFGLDLPSKAPKSNLDEIW